MNSRLQGGCQVPIASFSELHEGELYLRALVGTVDGSLILRSETRGDPGQAEQLGIAVADDLLKQGAGPILEALSQNPEL